MHILDDILDFSKIESGRLTLESIPLDIGKVVHGVVATLMPSAAQKHLQLDSRLAPDLPAAVLSDPVRLRQILYNLINNAIKFTATTAERSGRIEVEAALEACADGQAQLRLAVHDNGIGMDAAQQARLFQPFAQAEATITRRFGGTGLGLSIVKRLVDLMGGDIGVRSAPGAGSTFTVRLALPLAPPARTARRETTALLHQEPEDLATAESGGRLILVAEDNAVNQQVIRHQLAWLGHPCLLAGNGREALALCAQHHVGLVLSDVHMPEMDGYAFTRALREREREQALPHTPIVAITASALAEEIERCRRAGMDDYLAKPVEMATLQDCLARWLPAPAGRALHQAGGT
jgi:CheY-like chemotaxis protein